MSMQEFTRIKNFIDGEWIEEKGTEYIPLYNPSTGEAIGEVPLSSDKTSLAAVDSAYEAYGSWRKLSVSKRVGFLFDMRQAMIDNEEKLAVSIAIDQAKHISEARGEIRRVIEIIEASCSIPTLIQGEMLNNIANNKGKFCRWGYQYDYHIGDLSAIVCNSHPAKKQRPKYKIWGDSST